MATPRKTTAKKTAPKNVNLPEGFTIEELEQIQRNMETDYVFEYEGVTYRIPALLDLNWVTFEIIIEAVQSKDGVFGVIRTAPQYVPVLRELVEVLPTRLLVKHVSAWLGDESRLGKSSSSES